ncbi:hypothetical protein J7L60_06440 [Candidatus Bathyarchaeota archaeon]|nr:hypothetical protein [Candidatus Bathyarchaeota archaeon]
MSRGSFPRERFGYHVVYDPDLFDAIDFAAEHGFGYIVPDLMVPRFFPENLDKEERLRIKEYAKSREVSISLHAPSDNLNLVAPTLRSAGPSSTEWPSPSNSLRIWGRSASRSIRPLRRTSPQAARRAPT